jgi:VWFA-related protein
MLALALSASITISGQSSTRRIYVTAVNEDGLPVTDLNLADIQVVEDDAPQKVTKVSLSNHPMRIALLVDTTESSRIKLPDLRAALDGFIDAIPPPHEILLVTTGQQVQVRVPPTADRKKLKDSADSLFGVGGGTLLFDAVVDVDDRFLKKPDDRTAVVVIVSGDGVESSQRYDEKYFDRVTKGLAQRNIPVHAVVFSVGTARFPFSIAMHLSQGTRGYAEKIGASTMLPDVLGELAQRIVEDDAKMSDWYEIEYVSTSRSAQPELQVGINRPGVRTRLSSTRRLP